MPKGHCFPYWNVTSAETRSLNTLIARELSEFTCTSSLIMNEKSQYRTRRNIFIIQIEYTPNKNRQNLSEPKPWCNDSGVLIQIQIIPKDHTLLVLLLPLNRVLCLSIVDHPRTLIC